MNKMGKEETPARERLMEAASRLFLQRGYSRVGIEEIIRESQIAKATFYSHFASKESLVESWLESIHQHAERRHREMLEACRRPERQVESAFDFLEVYLKKHDFRGCPFSNSCAVTDLASQRIRRQISSHKDSVRQFFRILCRRIVDTEKADETGDRIFLLYSGAAAESQNLRDLWPVEVARRAAMESCESLEKSPDH